MNDRKIKCDWCDNPAHFRAQLMKKTKHGYIGRSIYHYACVKDGIKLDEIRFGTASFKQCLSEKELIND